MLKRLMFGAAALAVLLPVQASAQQADADTITLYGKGHFKGHRITLEGSTRLSSPFAAKSVQIPAGKAWELCSGNTFTGCKEFNGSDESMIFNVRSARPIAPVITSSQGSPAAAIGTVGGGPWPSLRGLASEFFIAPDVGGNRILVASGKSEEASRLAEDFCRTRGWRTAAHERLQSIGGRTYLADLLCAESKK
jgi:hypothetical protein